MNRHHRRAQEKLARTANGPHGKTVAGSALPTVVEIFQTAVNYHKAERLAEAEACYRRALAIQPNHPDVVFNFASVLHKQGKLDEAIPAYRKAIALKPDFAIAHNGLGMALRDVNQLPEAREALEHAVRLAPDNARLRRGVAFVTHFTEDDPRLVELEQFVKNNAARSIEERIELHFALGKAYDDAGRFSDAFRHWLDGNELKRGLIDYDEAETLAELDQVRLAYSAELIELSHGGGNPSSRPVFIVGMPRSGSTLVEQILASHPQVFGGGELHHFPRAVEKALATPGGPPTADKAAREIAAHYLAEIERIAPDAAHVTDKLPRNFIFAGLIHLALPNAAIIHTARDPIDTCLSCFSILFGAEQDFTYNLTELGRYYRSYQNLMKHWHRVLPLGRILDVRYEDVVADLEGQARRIVVHCGLNWDARCLEFHKTERPVLTTSVMQVREPLYNRAVGRWRHYAAYLAPLIAELKLQAPR